MKLEETNRSLDEQLQSAMDDVGEKTTELETVGIESVYNVIELVVMRKPRCWTWSKYKSVSSVIVSCHWKTTQMEIFSIEAVYNITELVVVRTLHGRNW